MYPPAPEQPAASPYTPAGVTGNTPNTNANPNYAPQPQMQQAFQQQSPGSATPPTGMENNSFLQNVAQQDPLFQLLLVGRQPVLLQQRGLI